MRSVGKHLHAGEACLKLNDMHLSGILQNVRDYTAQLKRGWLCVQPDTLGTITLSLGAMCAGFLEAWSMFVAAVRRAVHILQHG